MRRRVNRCAAMKKQLHGQKIDTVFVLIIFCVFAASALMVLMLGGSIYKNTMALSWEGYDERTGLSYIWTKVKNGDENGRISLDDFHGLSVLCLAEQYGEDIYFTRIYLYDGWIRELFSEDGFDFYPQDGLPVAPAESLVFEQTEHSLIKVTVNSRSLFLYTHS